MRKSFSCFLGLDPFIANKGRLITISLLARIKLDTSDLLNPTKVEDYVGVILWH